MCGIFPNLALWGMTYPYNYMTHLGGRYQACTMPFDWTPQQAFGVRNIFNPMFRAFSFMGALQNNLYGSYNNMFGMQNSAMLGFNFGFNYGMNDIQERGIGNTIGEVGKLIDDINGGLASGKLTQEQKEKMEELKRQAEAIQQRLQDLRTLKANGASHEQVQAVLSQIKADFSALQVQAQDLSKEIKESQTSSNGGSTTTTTESDKEESDKEESDKEVKEPSKEEKYIAKQICAKLDKAIIGAGTNYDDDEEGLLPVMQMINDDNVMTVLDTWDKSYAKYGAYADDKKGFIESLMDDCGGAQKEQIASILIDALEKHALDLGIDVDAEVSKARMSTHANWCGWRDDDEICDAVNAIIKKIRGGSNAE